MDKQLVILIHGFNVSRPSKTIGRLSSFYHSRGIDTLLLDYGHFTLLDTRYKNDDVANRLKETIQRARKIYSHITCIGHSNGCAIINLCPDIRIDQAIYINPALKEDIAIPSNIKKVTVCYSDGDNVVPLSRFLFPSKNRPWGKMGKVGYIGKDKRVTNLDLEYLCTIDGTVTKNKIGHSDVFKSEYLLCLVNKII